MNQAYEPETMGKFASNASGRMRPDTSPSW